MKITHAWVSPAQALAWLGAVKTAMAKAGFTVRKAALQEGWAQALDYDSWATYEQAVPAVLITRAADSVPLAATLMTAWVTWMHEAMKVAGKSPCSLSAFKRAWTDALHARSWPKLDEALDRFNTQTQRRPLTQKEDRAVRKHLKVQARRDELTLSAIDWAVNAEELWEQSGEDADTLADLAIGATLDALGKGTEDEDSFDREAVVQAIETAFGADGRDAAIDTLIASLNRHESPILRVA